MSAVIVFGPLDEKEPTTGALGSNTASLLCMFATGLLTNIECGIVIVLCSIIHHGTFDMNTYLVLLMYCISFSPLE